MKKDLSNLTPKEIVDDLLYDTTDVYDLDLSNCEAVHKELKRRAANTELNYLQLDNIQIWISWVEREFKHLS